MQLSDWSEEGARDVGHACVHLWAMLAGILGYKMGALFQMRGQRGAGTEMANSFLGYSWKQALSAMSPGGLIAALASCPSRTKETTPLVGRCF
jgi:hypothetical protein